MIKGYIGEVVQDELGNNTIEIRSEHLRIMGWDEEALLQWMVDEELLNDKD